MPVIGFLNSGTAEGYAPFAAAIAAHQINLQRSLIGSEYQPIRGGRSAVLGLR